ncbi:hypothetical protein MNV49_002437 [Pseudohyphozyma bogoriensis]|nr:hypothetical protein MNV49_002437 [Pseudohyphozyma bogoriensis]
MADLLRQSTSRLGQSQSRLPCLAPPKPAPSARLSSPPGGAPSLALPPSPALSSRSFTQPPASPFGGQADMSIVDFNMLLGGRGGEDWLNDEELLFDDPSFMNTPAPSRTKKLEPVIDEDEDDGSPLRIIEPGTKLTQSLNGRRPRASLSIAPPEPLLSPPKPSPARTIAATLADLTLLSEFQGAAVPEPTAQSEVMSSFGPLLANPSRVTFPWAPLRAALSAYFASTSPLDLDPHRIFSGWCGLSFILTAFKRLEVVESEADTAECLAWLSAIKAAAVRRSLAFENSDGPDAGVLRNILANLQDPVPAELLVSVSRPSSDLVKRRRSTFVLPERKRDSILPETTLDSNVGTSTLSSPINLSRPQLEPLPSSDSEDDGAEPIVEEDPPVAPVVEQPTPNEGEADPSTRPALSTRAPQAAVSRQPPAANTVNRPAPKAPSPPATSQSASSATASSSSEPVPTRPQEETVTERARKRSSSLSSSVNLSRPQLDPPTSSEPEEGDVKPIVVEDPLAPEVESRIQKEVRNLLEEISAPIGVVEAPASTAPAPPTSSQVTSISPEPAPLPQTETVLSRTGKRPSDAVRGASPDYAKRRRSNSTEPIAVVPATTARDSTLSETARDSIMDTSTVSRFTDPPRPQLNPVSSTDSEDHDTKASPPFEVVEAPKAAPKPARNPAPKPAPQPAAAKRAPQPAAAAAPRQPLTARTANTQAPKAPPQPSSKAPPPPPPAPKTTTTLSNPVPFSFSTSRPRPVRTEEPVSDLFSDRLSTWKSREAATAKAAGKTMGGGSRGGAAKVGTKGGAVKPKTAVVRAASTTSVIPFSDSAAEARKRVRSERDGEEVGAEKVDNTVAVMMEKRQAEKQSWEARQKAREEENRRVKEEKRKMEEEQERLKLKQLRDSLAVKRPVVGGGKEKRGASAVGRR